MKESAKGRFFENLLLTFNHLDEAQPIQFILLLHIKLPGSSSPYHQTKCFTIYIDINQHLLLQPKGAIYIILQQ